MSYTSLQTRYSNTLNAAYAHTLSLLSAQPSSWAPIPSTSHSKTSATVTPQSHVKVHKFTARVSNGGPQIVRATLTLPISIGEAEAGVGSLEEWRAVLEREECKVAWDKLVERTTVLEVLDPHTRIAKTDFRLGWPASPRDAITITRTYMSPPSSPNPVLLCISTSVPPSPEGSSSDPGFLRPSPPYVRSNLYLMAWCIQLVEDESEGEIIKRVRVTVFWQWDLKGAMFSTHHKEIASLLSSFITYLQEHSTRIPITTRYGRLLSLTSSHFDSSSDTFTTQYSILSESDITEVLRSQATKDLEEVREDREERKSGMRTGIEFGLGLSEGWDVRIAIVGKKGEEQEDWIAAAERVRGNTKRFLIRFMHSKVEKEEQFQRYRITIQRLGGAASVMLKVNGKDCPISDQIKDERNPSQSLEKEESVIWFGGEEGELRSGVELGPDFGTWWKENSGDEASVTTNQSWSESGGEGNSGIEVEGIGSISKAGAGKNQSHRNSLVIRGKTIKPKKGIGPRTLEQLQMQMKKEINDKIRRSYIYFTSLLQEPEAKWRRVSEGRGVTVSKLDSIDPTLTIYRAEAVFVGLNVWDVFSTVSSAGARTTWDKTIEDIKLLEEVTDLSSLWRVGMKANWPVAPRDSIQLRTFYKSPTSIHVFSFSTDDLGLFPSIPPVPSGTIRTHTDLHGWSIEGLSPTTTQIILIDQSDPKGWSSKSWTPNYLINSIANVGEFAIKSGGPPLVTRLLGASTEVEKYDHDKSFFKLEYKASKRPFSITSWEDVPATADPSLSHVHLDTIECEIRCDCVTWASSIDVVIDPPPTRTSVLRRHRLSFSGGTWLTIEHSTQTVGSDRIFVLIRKGQSNREKGSVFINGSKAKVDTEDLPEDEVKNLSKQKRIKVNPMPLDQYPLIGPRQTQTPKTSTPILEQAPSATRSSFNGETTRSLPVLPGSPKNSTNTTTVPNLFARPPQSPPVYSLEGLSWLQQFYLEQNSDPNVAGIGWSEVSNKGGVLVRKKIVPQISDSLPVYQASKVIEGVTASDLADVLNNADCRKEWDDRIETNVVLESFGFGCYTSSFTTKSSFPLKGRVFCTSTVSGQFLLPGSSSSSSTSTVLFVASVSSPISSMFDQNKLNIAQLSPGQVLLEGWILEPIDPYTSNTYQIPSSRCTLFSCVDYLGSVTSAISSMLNTNFGRLLGSLEKLTKRLGALPHVHTPPTAFQIEGPLAQEKANGSSWEITDVTPSMTQSKLLLSHFNLAARSFRCYTVSTLRFLPPPSASSTLKIASTQRASRLTVKGTLRRDSSPSKHLPSHELKKKISSTNLDIHRRPRSMSNVSNGNPFDPDPLDLCCLAEIIVDLKLFPAGYDLNCAATFRSSSTGDELSPLNGDENLLPAFSKVPLHVSVTNVPVPAVFLEANGAGDAPKRVQHLVRIFVPLSDGEKEPRPSWYKKVKKGESVILDTRITQNPLADELHDDDNEFTALKGKMRVTFNGERVEIGEGRGLLGRSEDEGWVERLPKLSRPDGVGDEEEEAPILPRGFDRALCVSNKLIKPISSQPTPDPSPNGTPQPPAPASFDTDTNKDNEPQRNEQSDAAAPLGPEAESSKRISLASLHLKERSSSNPLLSLPGNLLSLTRNPSSPLPPTPSASSQQQPTSFSLAFLVTLCIICFLLGSLLRSLMTPIDFIFIPPEGDMTLEESLMDALDPNRRWRAARRLAQLRIPFLKWDIVVSMALRQ